MPKKWKPTSRASELRGQRGAISYGGGNGPGSGGRGNPNGFGKCKGEWGEGGKDSIGFRRYEVGGGEGQIFPVRPWR